MVRVARAGEREAVVAIPEAMLARAARRRGRASSSGPSPAARLPAKLRELSPVADGATRTFEARYALAEPDKAARARHERDGVAGEPRRPARSAELPLAALFDAGAGPVVWVVGADGRLEARPVTVADYAAGTARIAGGLADGDRVVVLGAHKLEAGEAGARRRGGGLSDARLQPLPLRGPATRR